MDDSDAPKGRDDSPAEESQATDTAADRERETAADVGADRDRETAADVGADHDRATTTDDRPTIEELAGPRRTLEPEIQAVWLVKSGAWSVVLGMVASVAFSIVSPLGAWVGGVVFAVVLLLGVVFAVLRYRSWSYEVREDSLYLERGVLTRVTTVVPYVRIQHVDASRGPVERAFGLATTVVYTAGSRGADVSIPGLTPERAEDLQTRLKQLAIAAEGEDAV